MSATPSLVRRRLMSVSQAQRSDAHVELVFEVTGVDGTFCSFNLPNTLLNTELHDSLVDTITSLKIPTSAAARPFTAHSHIPCRNTIRIDHFSGRFSPGGKRPNGPNPTQAEGMRERRRCTTVRWMENMLTSVGKNTSRWVSPSNENMQKRLLHMFQMSCYPTPVRSIVRHHSSACTIAVHSQASHH